MMGMLWAVLYVALTGSHLGYGLPVESSSKTFDTVEANGTTIQWITGQGIYAVVLAVSVIVTVVSLFFGCTWCYRHKDCKLFSTSASHLHDGSRRSQPPDSGFSEPSNNNISEDNNNGPISLREMQNIANNNASAYIVSENEERNRAASRESVVEFEPLPAAIGAAAHPLDRCADWFSANDFPRNRLQYLREIGRGWFGRVVEGEIEGPSNSTVAVRILNQDSTVDDKARFLDSARIYRDVTHDNVLRYVACSLQQEPWILVFELCSMDLQQYLVINRAKMASLNESGVPLTLQCDVASALAYLHSRGFLYGNLWSGNVLVRGEGERARGVLGRYWDREPPGDLAAPELHRRHLITSGSEVWSLGALVWEVCSWGAAPPRLPAAEPSLPCPYRAHLYQVMQLCWHPEPDARPTAAQVHSLLEHLRTTHKQLRDLPQTDCSDFEERWQRLKPNSIPKIDEHIAMVHAPSTSTASHFTGSEHTIQDTLSVELDTAVSRSSSIMSDKDHLSVQMKSESMNNLHGSLEDLRQTNPSLDDNKDKEQDKSDSSVDPWLKDIISGSQDDVSYYRDVSDVIKNLDNILNSEKTSSSESSHQASPSRDNLSLDCKKEYQVQSSLVKSPGITNFQNIIDVGYDSIENDQDDEADRDTIGTLSHSFERHSDTNSQHTLENLTPTAPVKDFCDIEACDVESDVRDELKNNDVEKQTVSETSQSQDIEMPNAVCQDSVNIPQLEDLCIESTISISEGNVKQLNVQENCRTSCDNINDTVKIDTHDPKLTKPDEDKSLQKEHSKLNAKIDYESNVEIPDEVDTSKIFVDFEADKKLQEPENPIIEQVAACLQDMDKDQILSFIESEKLFSSYNDVPTNLHINIAPSIIETKNTDVLFNNRNHLEPEMVRMAETVNVINFENSESSNDFSCDDRVIEGIVNSKEVIINSFIDPGQNNEEEMIYEDKHMSGEETSLEALNYNTHISEPSSTIDILPDLVEIMELPLEEMKTKSISESLETTSLDTQSTLPIEKPDDEVQNTDTLIKYSSDESCTNVDQRVPLIIDALHTSDISLINESTVYMDLINNTNNADNFKMINSLLHSDTNVNATCVNISADNTNISDIQNESTVYMDLPTVINATDKFLQAERVVSSETNDIRSQDVTASTPKSNENGDELRKNTNVKTRKVDVSSELNNDVTNFEQKFIPDTLTPFDSPTKSHPTDTYDENSSVVLGPFENCTLELFKGIKSGYTDIDIPKEEILAFSSNFSEINLETPSPLRDGNFLNEVPDIDVNEDLIFDDINDMSEQKSCEPSGSLPNPSQDRVDSHSEFGHPPSTPPNSPGTFLASTSKEKYLIDSTKPDVPNHDSDSGVSSLQKEIDLNQIEMTAKLAMAENENNLNIEYSGPLTVEGIVTDDEAESYLAGNGGMEERDTFTFDEVSMQALRNELELKLPLAQVASIEPSEDVPEWSAPELIVNYAGTLSPIAEETGNQLSAYENDRVWNTSNLTDSSESYLEPCNNSTDEVTDLPTGGATVALHSTYTVLSERNSAEHNTYTVQKDLTSRDVTMSADSLNGSPTKLLDKSKSPINDRTFTKEDEKETNCERLSQVSPFLLSPTTDTSVPEASDNVTGIITLSKTVPTDAKFSKPSETQCLSKATSIDSWCSNDTLYNVEENFDDLAMEPDDQLQFDKEDHSESADTLTHNDEDDKELSHCSTYIVHDSQSEPCETFSPDSIIAHHTYTKQKNEENTPMNFTEVNSTKSIPTKDFASDLGTYPSCTTELLSGADDILWRIQQPELVRRSPLRDDTIAVTPPRITDTNKTAVESVEDSPKLNSEPSIKKMDSVEISCLQDVLQESSNDVPISEHNQQIGTLESPDFLYRNMAQSAQSTPLLDTAQEDNSECIPMHLPDVSSIATSVDVTSSLPNYHAFISSAELRPQDMTSNQDTDLLLEGDTNTESREMKSPTYSDFELSAVRRPQDIYRSSQNAASITSSEDFHDFEDSVRNRPQDLTFLQHATSMLLQSERLHELETNCSTNNKTKQRHEECVNETNDDNNIGVIALPFFNTEQNDEIPRIIVPDVGLDDYEQPHSIIVMESPKNVSKESMNSTYNSHTTQNNLTFNSHDYKNQDFSRGSNQNSDKPGSPKTNGLEEFTCKSTEEQPKSIIEVASHLNCPNGNDQYVIVKTVDTNNSSQPSLTNGVLNKEQKHNSVHTELNGEGENFATVSYINESFEEISDSSVDSKRKSKDKTVQLEYDNAGTSNGDVVCENIEGQFGTSDNEMESPQLNGVSETEAKNETQNREQKKVTECFLENEKNFCQFDAYLPMLSDIRFTGPTTEIMSTSFNEDSPPQTPEEQSENNEKPCSATAEIMKEWDSDSDESHSSNPSSGEFIWKDGDGHETSLVPSDYFDHQRGVNSAPQESSRPTSGSESGSGSEGEEAQFVPSCWDCQAAPSKSALRSLDQQQESKKHVVFKRQKYHCVYEYPREVADAECDALAETAHLPDYSTYAGWAAAAAEEAELNYGLLYGGHPFDMSFPLRAGGVGFGSDYDEDFFISSSSHPFERLGVMSQPLGSSQFFPGQKALLEPSDDVTDFPAPPSPLPSPLPFTPDSGVEDVTPGSTATEEDFKTKLTQAWKIDSGSSSESVSPSSPGGEALGGLRHTRDKLKLDLPPSPHIPSPRHNRVFNFVLDKPKPRTRYVPDERPPEVATGPLVMTDETPVITSTLPLQKDTEDVEVPVPAPTFSTFGKCAETNDADPTAIILTDDTEVKPETSVEKEAEEGVEAVIGEGTVLDSGDEDSGIESSAKTTLDRNIQSPNVS